MKYYLISYNSSGYANCQGRLAESLVTDIEKWKEQCLEYNDGPYIILNVLEVSKEFYEKYEDVVG